MSLPTLQMYTASAFRQLNGKLMAGRYVALLLLNILVPVLAHASQGLATGMLYGISLALVFHDSRVIASGSFLAVLHGVTHMVWPFINENGISPEFSVFYDEVVHFLMGLWAHVVVLGITCKDSSDDIKAILNTFGSFLLTGNFISCIISIFLPADNEFFIDSAIFSALTSGYFGVAALSLGFKQQSGKNWSHIGHHFLMAMIVTGFFFLFRASHDVMSFMFIGRFFESFFMFPLWISLAADQPLFSTK